MKTRALLAFALLGAVAPGTALAAATPAPHATGNAMQGHAMQGHAMQGHAMQGHAMKGHAMKGQAMKGHAMKGASASPHAMATGAMTH